MRNRFAQELEELNKDLLEMGALAERAINEAVASLMKQDADKAYQVSQFEAMVDDKEKEIESRCFKLLLQQQPVATDLRLISTALKMATDLERIGDQAQDIGEIALRLIDDAYTGQPKHLAEMAQAASQMVTRSIDAYVSKNLSQAIAVIESDDVVDGLFIRIKNDLVELLRSDSDAGEHAIDLLMVAKYLERIGDHATNIAGWVIFSITGEHGNKRVL